ncbi:hypothetical protein MSG28_011807 [Choristoneura fumiferana]|uniref:Uncharacterized protein n=1 Tax=Choristoneura fumiferana TaxID=7141 RepID=A0ACC0KM31_CHOFU|nr:hypothetical protein MSG28_011807 [Choristoneura fumiferana]
MNLKSILLVLSLAWRAFAYKILLLAPIPIRSLNILGVGYVRHLINAGHEVTYVSAYPVKDISSNNFRQVDLSDTHLNLIAEDDSLNISYLMSHPLDEDGEIEYLQISSVEVGIATFENKQMLALLNDPSVTFDVVICDFVESEIYAALAAYYDCPMIWEYSMGSHWQTLRLIDETTNPAYAFDYLTSDIPPHHSVGTRVKKVWSQIKWQFMKYKTLPLERGFYYEFFGPLMAKKNKPLPDYDALIYNASLVLSNDYVGNGRITSVPQNFKFIGGYHIETPTKPVPTEIKTILDNAQHGFIYFSMGSLWRSKDIPEHVTKALLDLFGSLKETVMWKYEDKLLNVPKNVHIVPWAPQQTHPKCKFFISHGGLLSTLESIHFGVPTIGIPLYFDQFINVNRDVISGRTVKVDFTLNLVEDLRLAIQKIRHPSYKQQAMELSQIYHDRPVSPGKELVHWVEHVIKTGGAPHLRSPASMMPWYQKMFLDNPPSWPYTL